MIWKSLEPDPKKCGNMADGHVALQSSGERGIVKSCVRTVGYSRGEKTTESLPHTLPPNTEK